MVDFSKWQELGEHPRSLSFQELGILKRKHGLSMQAWMRRALDLCNRHAGRSRAVLSGVRAGDGRSAEKEADSVPVCGRSHETAQAGPRQESRRSRHSGGKRISCRPKLTDFDAFSDEEFYNAHD
jgi:hypothetical protein